MSSFLSFSVSWNNLYKIRTIDLLLESLGEPLSPSVSITAFILESYIIILFTNDDSLEVLDTFLPILAFHIFLGSYSL